MVADPKLAPPVTCGCVAGTIEPAAMKTLAGVTVILVTSLLRNVIVTPPEGAGAESVTGNALD